MAKKPNNGIPIDEALRRAIASSGKSANELAKLTDVPQTTISGFIRGREMGISKAAKIATYLGLRLEPETKTVVVHITKEKAQPPLKLKVTSTKAKR